MIEVLNLSKSYKGHQVLSDVSFVAENGYVTGFVGPNGAGKSTTMRMIACLEEPDSGTATVDGQKFSRSTQPVQTMGAYLGSEYLPNHMSSAEYLRYVCRVGGISKDRIAPTLEMVELSQAADKPISSYSLGMRQRCGLAAAIIGSPSTLMLDEPVNGLDPMGVQWLRGVIRSQADSGKAVLLSSHLLSELELVADRVVMLDRGTVIRQGDMSKLESAAGTTRVLMHTSNDKKVAGYLGTKNVSAQLTSEGVLVDGVPPEKLARLAFKAKLELYRLEEKKATLEELFISSTATAPAPPLQYQPYPQQPSPQVQYQQPMPSMDSQFQQGNADGRRF